MDGENDEFLWEIHCKNIKSKEVFGKFTLSSHLQFNYNA